MTLFPDTRKSLVLRIADAADAEAWGEFARVYEPVLYRLARRRGLQDADAHEVIQETLMAVARAVEGWVPDESRGRFRDWLRTIARNLCINYLTRRKHRPWAAGDTQAQQAIDGAAASDAELSQLFELEYRREAFRAAAERIRKTVTEKTWQAFWLSSVEDRPIDEVARQLQMSPGSVYIARCRLMARLREEVKITE